MKTLKDKAKKAALKGQEILLDTLRNMSPAAAAERYRAADEHMRDRNREMIRNAFGSEENYLATLPEPTPSWRSKLAHAIEAAHARITK